MPRRAREKHSEAIYHIICRSVSEIKLFRDDADRDYYLRRLKRTADKYKCSIYSYCLLDNHLHIQLDPKGYDVSKFMHSLNTSYVIYYNRRHKRHGHVFQERFQSKILNSDRYNLVVSAYIHMNSKDIIGMAGREEIYKYSSYGIYLGLRKDEQNLIDTSFIRGLICTDTVTNSNQRFIDRYREFVRKEKSYGTLNELKDEKKGEKGEPTTIRKTINREISPSRVMFYISSRLRMQEKDVLTMRRDKLSKEVRAFAAYVLRALCGLGYRQICEFLFGISESGCSMICEKGYELTNDKGLVYRSLFEEMICYQTA